MKIILSCFLVSILILAGCGTGGKGGDIYYCPMHPTYTSDRPGDCPICNMKLVKKTPEAAAPEKTPEEICVEHTCTMKDCVMHVKVGLKPGEKISCPVCGEYITTESGKLIEAPKESLISREETVMISPEKQKLIGVTTEPIKKMPLKKEIRASGKVAYDPELVVTQEEFIQALINEERIKGSPLQDVVDRASALTEAARRRLALLGMNEGQIAELEKTKRPDTNLYLPKKGEAVWVYLAVYEYEIGLVRVGEDVRIEAAAYPGEVFYGEAASINPVLDAETRTNQVRLKVDNPGDKLKPEMFVNATILVDMGEKLAVRDTAVLDTGLRKIVFISRGGDVLESREVRLGRRAGDYYEVLEGLKEGDIVVTSGNFFIDSEARLKAALSGTAGHQHGQ